MLKKSVVVLFFILISACATHKGSVNSFVDPSFTDTKIARLAVFPIRNTRAAPAESRQINRRVALELRAQNPRVELVNEVEASSLIDGAGLGEDWASFVTGFAASGIPDVEKISGIGSAIGVDAILQGELVSVQQTDGVYGVNSGTTRVTVRYTLLDARDGRLLWETSAEGRRQTATTLQSAPPVIEAVELAVEKILENLPPLNTHL